MLSQKFCKYIYVSGKKKGTPCGKFCRSGRDLCFCHFSQCNKQILSAKQRTKRASLSEKTTESIPKEEAVPKEILSPTSPNTHELDEQNFPRETIFSLLCKMDKERQQQGSLENESKEQAPKVELLKINKKKISVSSSDSSSYDSTSTSSSSSH
jgi:hypothetical protein